MGRECIGICGRYETTYNRAAYSRGFKWCARCRSFIKITTVMCPCCNGFLRTKSHQTPLTEPLVISQKGESKIA